MTKDVHQETDSSSSPALACCIAHAGEMCSKLVTHNASSPCNTFSVRLLILFFASVDLVQHSCICTCMLSPVWLFVTPWTVVHQAHLVHGIFQARTLEQVIISYSRGSSWPRGQTHISCISRQILYHCVTWEDLSNVQGSSKLMILDSGNSP